MTRLLQSEVDYIFKNVKNPKFVTASKRKTHGGKTYMLTDDSPLITIVAQLRGYTDKRSFVSTDFPMTYLKYEVENEQRVYVYTAEQQCIDENKYD